MIRTQTASLLGRLTVVEVSPSLALPGGDPRADVVPLAKEGWHVAPPPVRAAGSPSAPPSYQSPSPTPQFLPPESSAGSPTWNGKHTIIIARQWMFS